jgi:hypothetical protein
MKRLSVLLVILGLASCGGGGGSSAVPAAQNAAPATSTPLAPTATPTPGSGLAPTSLPLQVSAFNPTSSVDRADRHAIALVIPTSGIAVPSAQLGKVHLLPVQSGVIPSVRTRRPSTFFNSPLDVSYFGGTVVGGTVSHNIYVSSNYRSCGTTCWGTPGQFLADLGASSFISHLDQYIGLNTPNRYTKGDSFTFTEQLLSANPANNPVVSQSDLMLLIYYAGLYEGTGYGHIFHLFLHPGLDTCIDLTSSCYSPDNPRTFRFCAYHGSADFFGHHYLYTVEPYQDVPGCKIVGGPNAQGGDDLIDSTANTLSHEMFETITDPDITAWMNAVSLQEIGDLCQGFLYSANLNGTNYGIQSEYSDVDHSCIN